MVINTQIYLAFNERISKTICAFPNEQESVYFANRMHKYYHQLPTINPLLKPIPFFNVATDAINHFENK